MTTYENGDPIISIVPIAVFMDHRLTANEIRVIGAILSFRNKDTGICAVKRETLAARCLLPLTKISTFTTSLMRKGWLVKEGSGGFSKASTYRITVPDLVTVTDTVTVTESVTTTVTESVTKTVTETVTRNEQSSEQSIEQSKTSSSWNAHEALTEDKQPGGASSGGEGSHNGEPAKPVASAKRKASIPSDWKPDERCLELLEEAGITREFSASLVGEFRLYWEERGDKRPGWSATFINHAKVQWTRQQERPKSGTTITPYRSGAAHSPSRVGTDFRTISEMRAQRNIEIALEFANERNERVINE